MFLFVLTFAVFRGIHTGRGKLAHFCPVDRCILSMQEVQVQRKRGEEGLTFATVENEMEILEGSFVSLEI